jgi:hypothetical protein
MEESGAALAAAGAGCVAAAGALACGIVRQTCPAVPAAGARSICRACCGAAWADGRSMISARSRWSRRTRGSASAGRVNPAPRPRTAGSSRVAGEAGGVIAMTSRATACAGGCCPRRSGAMLALIGSAGDLSRRTWARASSFCGTLKLDRATGRAETKACCGTTVTASGLSRFAYLAL